MLSPGMQVLLEVSVRFHPVFGLSLQVSGIDPSYTLGDLARQRQKTIQRLQDEGVFDLQQQLSLPTLPKRIAVVSSPDAAGYGDFTHQLLSSGFSFHPVLFPAIMQGDRAAVSIIEALGKIYDESGNFDVVVIIRGGGATTDLSCFDNYELAFHITQFPLPVLSGIGHQRDVSVVDMVSYLSEKTPTAVAECLVSEMQQQQEKLTLLSNRMFASADKRISLQREKLRVVITMLRNVSFSFINRQTNRLALAQKTLLLLSPAEIYRKGYSLARVNGKTVRSIADVKPGDVITTCLADGSIESTVNDK